MTRQHDPVLKPWIAAVSLGATVGGWVLLARQAPAEVASPEPPAPTATPAATQSIVVELPPVPTVAALRAYARPVSGAAAQLDLPPVPVVIEPAPRPQLQAGAPVAAAPVSAPAAPAPQPQPAPPAATTRTSK